MKQKKEFYGKILAIPILILMLSGCARNFEMNPDLLKPAANPAALEELMLESNEEEMLLFMVEEEKLAHDIYENFITLYPGIPAFKNITRSETNHVEKVRWLMDCFGIEDPSSDSVGVFINEELGALYIELLELGSSSLASALVVGATIEEIDIADLDVFMGQTENEQILVVFEYLACGSRNHLRAFDGNMDFREIEFTPAYITVDLYNTITEASHEFCSMAQN